MNTLFYTQFITCYWRDILEILFFSMLFYYLALWLRKDRQKNLLWYFYGYCACTSIAYYIQLPTLIFFLFLFSPVIIMLFITVHQETLQRNLVALKHIAPIGTSKKDWLEIILRSCLVSINNNKSITYVIEQTDRLSEFLQAQFLINAEINDDILNILIASKAYNEQTMTWIHAEGKIVGINVHWQQPHITSKKLPNEWQDNALIYTSKTDAIVLHINPTHTFTIIIDGKEHQNINTHHAHSFIKKYLVQSFLSKQEKKGEIHDHILKKDPEQQRTP